MKLGAICGCLMLLMMSCGAWALAEDDFGLIKDCWCKHMSGKE